MNEAQARAIVQILANLRDWVYWLVLAVCVHAGITCVSQNPSRCECTCEQKP